MKKLLLAVGVVAFVSVGGVPVAQPFRAALAQAPRDTVKALPSFAEPGISPDGSTIAFVSGGDVWEVPARGGDARLLVSHPASESRPLFAPDGARLAFTSTRTGNGDVYVRRLGERRTHPPHVRRCERAGDRVVAGREMDLFLVDQPRRVGRCTTCYRVGAGGGTPMAVAADRYTTEYFAAPAPAGDAVAITARANAGSQWWRKGHSHLDESEIWLVRGAEQERQAAAALRADHQRRREGRVADVGRRRQDALLHVGPQRRTEHLVYGCCGAGQRQSRSRAFKDGRVLWPSISRDGKTIAFERDFGIWTVDTATGQAREVADCAARRAGWRGHRPSYVHGSDPGARDFAGRQESSRSPCTARFFPRRPRMAAMRCGSPPRPARRRSWPGRPTAGGSCTCRTGTAPITFFSTTSATGQGDSAHLRSGARQRAAVFA